jgi:hypothetical protein
VEGLVARYQRDGQPVDLLLVVYPDAQRAGQGRAGLQGAGLENLIAVDVAGTRLGAVLGAGPGAAGAAIDTAQALLEEALTAE